MKAKKNLIVVGDRVLIEPEEGADKTTSALLLPDTVKEKQKVVGGYVAKAGPGILSMIRTLYRNPGLIVLRRK